MILVVVWALVFWLGGVTRCSSDPQGCASASARVYKVYGCYHKVGLIDAYRDLSLTAFERSGYPPAREAAQKLPFLEGHFLGRKLSGGAMLFRSPTCPT